MEMALNMFSSNTQSKREVLFKAAIEYAEDGFSPSQHLLDSVQHALMEGTSSHSFSSYQDATWFQDLK